LLHESDAAGCNAIDPIEHNNCFLLADVDADVTSLLTAAGFPKVNVKEVANNDARFAKLWKQDPTGLFVPISSNGVDINYFDFWIFFEKGTSGSLGHAGKSEELDPKTSVNVAAVTKHVMTPIVFGGASGGYLDSSLKACDKGEERRLFANLI